MARRLHDLPLFVVLVVTTVTTAMPNDGAEEDRCPTAGSPDGDALLQASSVLQASAVVVEATKADSGHHSTEIDEMRAGTGSSSDLSDDLDDRSYEENKSLCDISPQECLPELVPNCEIDLRDIQCVPKGSVKLAESGTSNCSNMNVSHCATREGCELAPNLDCVPKETGVSSLLEKRRRTGAKLTIDTIHNHPRCTPMFPNLEVHVGNHGDVCRSNNGEKSPRACPEGCTSVPGGGKPYCLDLGTRSQCRRSRDCSAVRHLHHTEKCNDPSVGCPFPYFGHPCCLVDSTYGNYCKGGPDTSWIAPLGCAASSVRPWSFVPGTSPRKPCRIRDGTPNGPQALWQLIASGTHGVTATMEVGMSTADGSSVSAEATRSFGMQIRLGVSLPAWFGSVSGEVEASVETSSMVGKTIQSALEQSEVRTVTVECPDYFVSPTEDRHVSNSRIEYIWQFVVSNGEVIAKTVHFRCHQPEEGERSQMPQCLPQLCNDDLCQDCRT